MTNEQELNKKLAEWAIPAAIEVQVQERQIVVETDEGTGSIELLTQSLDACFKWLVPKLQKEGKPVTLQAYEHKGYQAIIYNIFSAMAEPIKATNDNPALALCLAIEKLIDGEQSK